MAPQTKSRQPLLDDFERGALAVTGGGTGKQRADGLDRLAVTTDYPANIGLPKLQLEHGGFPVGDLMQHHLVGKLDELTDNEFEKLFHAVLLVAAVYDRRKITPSSTFPR